MSLLAPAGLFLLLLLPPVIAMHLWRVRYRRYTLSSTLLWSRVLSETPLRRPRRLPAQYLLLLLQLAVLACGVAALARPAWVAAGPRRHHLLVAVDTSLAMSARDVRPSRLAQAQGRVRALIEGLVAGDTMTLVDVGTAPRVLAASSDRAVLQRGVDMLSAGDGPSSLAGDGPLLAGLAAASGARTQAYLFAPRGVPMTVLHGLARAVRGLREREVGGHGGDRAVAALSVSCAATACEAYARLVNTAATPLTTNVTALVDGVRLTRHVTLPARGAVPISLAPLPGSLRTVELRLDGHDALSADDVAWAVVRQPVRRAVLLVTADSASPLAQALRAIPGLTVRTATPDDTTIDAQALGVDVTVLDNTGADILPPGNLLFINPFASALFDTVGTATAPRVTATDADSALLRGVDLDSLVIAAATRVRPPSWAHADIVGDAGPLLFSGATGGQHIAVLLFDPRPGANTNASNLDTLLAFPTLLQNAVQTLAPAAPTSAPAGQPALVPLARQGTPRLRLGTGAAVPLPMSDGAAILPPLHPGLYTLSLAAGSGDPIAVDAAGPQDVATTTAGEPGASAPGMTLPAVPVPLTPWEGWGILAFLALALLSGEWWYYVRRT